MVRVPVALAATDEGRRRQNDENGRFRNARSASVVSPAERRVPVRESAKAADDLPVPPRGERLDLQDHPRDVRRLLARPLVERHAVVLPRQVLLVHQRQVERRAGEGVEVMLVAGCQARLRELEGPAIVGEGRRRPESPPTGQESESG